MFIGFYVEDWVWNEVEEVVFSPCPPWQTKGRIEAFSPGPFQQGSSPFRNGALVVRKAHSPKRAARKAIAQKG
jgi:hypothetical protein